MPCDEARPPRRVARPERVRLRGRQAVRARVPVAPGGAADRRVDGGSLPAALAGLARRVRGRLRRDRRRLRLQLKRPAFAALLAASLAAPFAAPARADELVLRGNYYRDRNTRVIQPEAVFTKEAPHGIVVGGHYLLDTITS